MISWDGSWPLVSACSAVIICALLAVRGLLFSGVKNNHKRSPPGPWGIPVPGYLPFIRKPYHVFFKELSERYGPIIRLRLGSKDVVVLNDLASIREGLTNPDVLYRSDDFVLRYLGSQGLTSLNGQPWQENRKYCFHVMRNLGFAKMSMEARVQEEVQGFMDILASEEGETMLVDQALTSSVGNSISALVYGQRYNLDDPKGRFLQGLLREFLHRANFFSVIDFVPVLRALSFYIPYTQLYMMKTVYGKLTQFVRNEIKEREGSMDDYVGKDFFDGYLRKISENNGKSSYFSRRDTLIGGYHIPDGTLVIPCLWSLHNDPTHWRNPSKYDPTRFLNADGTEVDEKPLAFLPFSIGRRSCPGESLALMEVFLYVTTTLQRFRVLPERGRQISLEGIDALLLLANDTQGLRFLPR